MEPFSKDDPLYDLLGKARPVEPRPNFTQNVMRDIRNTPQEKRNWLATLLSRLDLRTASAPALVTAAAAIALILGVVYLQFGSTDSNSGTVTLVSNAGSNSPSVPEAESAYELDPAIAAFEEASDTEAHGEAIVASELDSMDQLSDLLASQDTSSLTDGQLAMLLY